MKLFLVMSLLVVLPCSGQTLAEEIRARHESSGFAVGILGSFCSILVPDGWAKFRNADLPAPVRAAQGSGWNFDHCRTGRSGHDVICPMWRDESEGRTVRAWLTFDLRKPEKSYQFGDSDAISLRIEDLAPTQDRSLIVFDGTVRRRQPNSSVRTRTVGLHFLDVRTGGIQWAGPESEAQPGVRPRSVEHIHRPTMPYRAYLSTLANGKQVLFQRGDRILLWDQSVRKLSHIAKGYGPSLSPDESAVAYLSVDGRILIRTLATGQETSISQGTSPPIWSPCGSYLLFERKTFSGPLQRILTLEDWVVHRIRDHAELTALRPMNSFFQLAFWVFWPKDLLPD